MTMMRASEDLTFAGAIFLDCGPRHGSTVYEHGLVQTVGMVKRINFVTLAGLALEWEAEGLLAHE